MSKVTYNKVKAGDLELKEKVVTINRVVKTTKGGRAFSFSALVVVGNEKGIVGHGLGKAKEVQEAITKGIEDAKKNLIQVPVMKGTIPHDQLAKEGAAKVLIKPAATGTGVIAGGSMRAVLESAGLTDILAKSLGSANPHNVVKATFKALAMLREPINVSRTRNISLKKVFNG
jgi:small subunit ribosomal protein S5